MKMNKKSPIGIDDFGKLANNHNQYLFVDKSLFIKEVIEDKAEVTLITRPRRWGKTLNLSMLEYFFARDMEGRPGGLFDSLQITQVDNGKYLAHQHQYPVIFISFKDVKEDTFDLAIAKIKVLVKRLFRSQQPYLSESQQLSEADKQLFDDYMRSNVDQVELSDALFVLSELLFKHYEGKTVYILIDEYDTPLNLAYYQGYVDKMTAFMRNLFTAALKGNRYLKKGVMTGILRISKDSMLSGLNNIRVHSVLSERYDHYFGFTDEEVKSLFSAGGLSQDLNQVREYYNGYRMGNAKLYNPWSIINCLDDGGQLATYWINTASDEVLQALLIQASSDLKRQFQGFLIDRNNMTDIRISETVRFDELESDDTALWTLLLALGYLTPVDKYLHETYYRCDLVIPNQEVKLLYLKIFRGWLRKSLKETVYMAFMKSLKEGRVKDFTHDLETYLLTYGTGYDFERESNYHTFMLGLLCGLTDYYALYSNTAAGLGRADIMLVPFNDDGVAIILELKHEKIASLNESLAIRALSQINTKNYAAFLNRYSSIERVLKIGLAFSNRQAVSAYRWEDRQGKSLGDIVAHQTVYESD